MRLKVPMALAGLAMVAAACGSSGANEDGTQTIRLLTHDSFVVSEGTIEAFEAKTGNTVEIIRAGEAGTMLNQAILTKDNPIADVIFGIDNTFLGRALEEGIFQPYTASGANQLAQELKADEMVTPIDFGDVCLNYDKAAMAALGLAPPESLADLTDPAYAGLLVVEDPGTSSPGLAFLLATIDEFGEDGWEQYWAGLKANDVLISPDWEAAYNGEFSGGAGQGDRPIVVSYASSPPAEVIFGDPRPAEAPTAMIEAGCFRQIEYAGIVAGTPIPIAAGELIDFMVTVEFQEDIPLNMFMFPASTEAALPAEFVDFTTIPATPAMMTPAAIDEGRDRWIRAWTEVMTP